MSEPDRAFEHQMRLWRTPAGVRRAYTAGRFGQVHYRIATPAANGRAPLICFHLSPNSGRVYGQWLAAMGRDRVAVAPDTPGFGHSDAPREAPDIADYAAAMGELIDTLGFDRVDLMGYHTGSLTCIELAQQRPDLVRRIVLVSAPVFTASELETFYERMGTPAADAIQGDGSHLARRWQVHFRWKDKDAPPIFVQREVSEALLGGDTAWWGHHAAFRYPLADNLTQVRQPTLVLCPEDDLWTQTQRARPLIQNGHLHELPGYAHGMLDAHTEELAGVVRGFLDGPANDLSRAVAKPAPPPPRAVPHRVPRGFMNGPDGQLHYRIVAPEKPARVPLVCFHLSPDSGRIYEQILTRMGRDRIAVAPDTPGFGESDAPPAPPDIADYARTMAHLIDALGLPQVDLMGYHTGSETVIELALQRPELVRRIVQISCPIWTPEELAVVKRKRSAWSLKEDGSHLAERWCAMKPYYRAEVPNSVLATHMAESQRGGPATPWGHRAAHRYDLGPKLPLVAQPILIVSPNDELREHSRRGLPLMANGQLHEIDHWGHGFIDVIPNDFDRILRNFLDKPD